MTQHRGVDPVEQGMLGMPRPQGWTIERIVALMAGSLILVTLGLGHTRSPRWRIVTGLVGISLLLDAAVGWCPASLVLHRLGVPTAGERASGIHA